MNDAYSKLYFKYVFLNNKNKSGFLLDVYSPKRYRGLINIAFKMSIYFIERDYSYLFISKNLKRYSHAYYHYIWKDIFNYLLI